MIDKTSRQSQSTDKAPSFVLENIFVVNAYYDIMTNSFKPTLTKTMNLLEYVRITPIIVDQNENDSNKIGSTKNIQFVDSYSNEHICTFRTKFWQSQKEGSNDVTIKENKRNSFNSSDSKFSLQQSNFQIQNPIYFYLFNFYQDFTEKFTHFFNEND